MRAKTRFCLLVAMFLCETFGFAGVALVPADAVTLDTAGKSLHGEAPAIITFYNNLDFKVDLYWINYDGNRVFYATIGANSSCAQHTYMTHPWLIVKTGTGGTTAQGTGELIAAFEPFTSNPSSVSLGDTATIGVGTDLSTSVRPASLAFDGFQNGPVQRALLEIGATRPGQPFTISKVGGWLSAVQTSGITPATITIEADPAGLPPNGVVYPGTIFVNVPGATPSQVGVPVTFGVGNPRPAQVAVRNSPLTVGIRAGLNSVTGCFEVYNAGSGTIGPLQIVANTNDPGVATFNVFPSTVTLNPINNTVLVCVTVHTNTSGTHTGSVFIYRDGNIVVTVPVTQVAVPVSLFIDPSSVFISGIPPDFPVSLNPIVKPLTLLRGHGLGLATYQATGTPAWVTGNPPAGTFVGDSTPLALELKFTTVAQGGYYGKLKVDDGITHYSPAIVDVVVEVSNTLPQPVEIDVSNVKPLTPGDHDSEVYRLQVNSMVEQEVRVTADYGSGPVFFTFERLPTEVAYGSVEYPVRVSLFNPLLPPGVYVGDLVLTYANQVATARVMAIIPPPNIVPLKAGPAAAACTPTRIIPFVRTPLQNFSRKTAWPTPLSVAVVDDCGNLDNTSSVAATFSNGDPMLTMDPAGDGVWFSTWVGQNPSDRVQVTFTAFSRDGSLSGSASMFGSLALNPLRPPLVFGGGIVDGASFTSGGTVSTGSIISIFGSGLANGTASAASVPLPSTLAGASVEIGGINAPLFYASDGQVNAVIPYGIPVDGPVNVTVKHGDALAVARSVRLTSAAPGIFTRSQNGQGQAAVLNSDYSQNGLPQLIAGARPARRGEVIQIYASGGGATTPALLSGEAAPGSGNPLVRTNVQPTVTLGGLDAPVRFSGMAPGFVGLWQINAEVPAGVAPGSAVPLVVSSGGGTSNTVTIAVE